MYTYNSLFYFILHKMQEPTHSKGHTLDLVLDSGLSPKTFEMKDLWVSDAHLQHIWPYFSFFNGL